MRTLVFDHTHRVFGDGIPSLFRKVLVEPEILNFRSVFFISDRDLSHTLIDCKLHRFFTRFSESFISFFASNFSSVFFPHA